MTIVSLCKPTGAFASGVLCDDYAYTYSNPFSCAYGHSNPTYVIFHSGYGVASGINYNVEVSNDVITDPTAYWHVYKSGTVAGSATTGVSVTENYALSRVGLRIDISGGTAVSGFAWVAV